MYTILYKMRNQELSEVISFRVSQETLHRLDQLAMEEMRTRGNLIMVLINRSLAAIESVTSHIEWLVKALHEEEKRNPDSPQAEYLRGQLHSTKSLLALFCGEPVKARVLDEVRKSTKLAIPHIVPLAPDGNRYGFDSDAG